MSEITQISNISGSLKVWAVKEMGFRKNESGDIKDTITSIDLDGICLGPLADVWSYVIKNVRAENTVQKVKGNLKLNSEADLEDKRKTPLLKERDRLKQEVADLIKTTEILSDSIQETTISTHEKEKELMKMQSTYRDLKRSSYLLHCVKKKTQDDIKQLKQTMKNLEQGLQLLLPKLEQESDLDRFRIDIEKMCLSMQSSLDELVNENPNLDQINQLKSVVGSNLASLLETLPHPQFLQLVEEQQKADGSLKSKLEVLGSPTNGKLTDFRPQELQPLQKLLYDLSWFHAQCRFRADKARQKTEELKSDLNMLKADLTQQLSLQFSNEDQALHCALQLVDAEIKAASRKAAIATLSQNIQELEAFCSRSEANQAEIEQKIATIEQNGLISDHLSALICTLVRKHTSNPQTIHQSVARLQTTVSQDVKNSHGQLTTQIQLWQSNLDKELRLYKQVRPCQLFQTRLDKELVPINRLTMNRFLPLTTGPSVSVDHMELVLKHLGLPRSIPVFTLFETIAEKRAQMGRMQQSVKWHQARNDEMIEKYGLSWLQHGTVHYTDLVKRLKDKRQNQESEMIPSLENRLKKMDEANQLNNDIQIAIAEWCNEPAKLIETVRTVNGKRLDEWRPTWNQLLTACRKKN